MTIVISAVTFFWHFDQTNKTMITPWSLGNPDSGHFRFLGHFIDFINNENTHQLHSLLFYYLLQPYFLAEKCQC